MAKYHFPYYRADENGQPVAQEIVVEADSEEQAIMLITQELYRRG